MAKGRGATPVHEPWCRLRLASWALSTAPADVGRGPGGLWGRVGDPTSLTAEALHAQTQAQRGRERGGKSKTPHSLRWGLCAGAFPAPSPQRQRQTLRQGVGNREKPGVRGWRQTPRQVPGRGGERGLREGVHGGYGVSLGYLHKGFPNDLCLRPPTGRQSQQ